MIVFLSSARGVLLHLAPHDLHENWSSEMNLDKSVKTPVLERRYFIGGSDARIIMGGDEAALIRLWQEKRGEVEPANLADELVVQLGLATEELNRAWYERNSGYRVRQC